MEKHKETNAMVVHRYKTGHNIKYDDAVFIKYETDTRKRRCFESAHILFHDTMNLNNGFFSLAKPLAFLLTNFKPE